MDVFKILSSLQSKRNVLLMGAPGTGKSKLMNDVARTFKSGGTDTAIPVHQPGAVIPIPSTTAASTMGTLPMMQRANRKVFRTTLHQNSKYRDFLTGITPKFDNTDGYQVFQGILYRANEFAKQDDSASLLIIDELNRGPVIEVFGGSIVAIESDKRLADDNMPAPYTQYFEIMSPDNGENEEYAFSPHLYILAAMNQADVSVAPLDVAFMRRWMSVMLYPDYQPLYDKFNVNRASQLSDTNPTTEDIYHAAFLGLEAVNKKIVVGRGAEYQLGQGVFLSTEPKGESITDALDFVTDCWAMIYAHIEELFFGEPNALSYILNSDKTESPYSLEEITFAGDTKFVLTHKMIDSGNIYDLYRSLLEATR